MKEAAPVQSAPEEKEKEKEVELIEVESDDDLASLFGENDDDAVVEAVDDAFEAVDDAVFEADMNEAFDWALNQPD